MSAFAHAQSIKTVHAEGGGEAKNGKILYLVVECPLLTIMLTSLRTEKSGFLTRNIFTRSESLVSVKVGNFYFYKNQISVFKSNLTVLFRVKTFTSTFLY